MGVLRLGEVKNRTSGGFPFLHKAFLNCLPAFFFGSRGANENSLRCAQLQLASQFALSKKEHAARDVSPRARGDQRSARWMGGRFLKKATEKLSARHRRGVLESPTNQNLNHEQIRITTKGIDTYRIYPKNLITPERGGGSGVRGVAPSKLCA